MSGGVSPSRGATVIPDDVVGPQGVPGNNGAQGPAGPAPAGNALDFLRLSAVPGTPEAVSPAVTRAALGTDLAKRTIPLAGASRVDFTQGIVVIGGTSLALDPATYARTGLTPVFTLRTVGFVSDAARIATLDLFNLTTGLSVLLAGAITTSAIAQTALSGVATIAGTPLLELRFSVDGALITDWAAINSAILEVTWS